MQKVQSIKDQAVLYQYPPNFDKAEQHRKATIILKQTDHINQNTQIKNCQCCSRIVGQYPKKQICYKTKDKFKYYGPGIPLYFLFFRITFGLLIVSQLIFGIYAFVSDILGRDCFDADICASASILNLWSLFNVVNNVGLVIAQKWTIVALTIVLVILILIAEYYIYKKRIYFDSEAVTPSDYAIIIRKIPLDALQDDIRAMILNFNNNILKPQQRREAHNCQIETIVISYDMKQYLKTKKQNLSNFKKSVKSKKNQDNPQFQPKRLPSLTQFTGVAIVVFKYQATKNFFIHTESNFQRFLHYVWWQYSPLSNAFQIKGQYVAVQRAPQPDDIIWQNCGISACYLFARKAFFFILVSLIVVGGGGVQYGLLKWQQAIENADNLYSVQVGFAVFKSAFVTLFNFLIQRVLIFASSKQRNDTKTKLQTVLTQKMVWFKFLNTGIFVLLAHIFSELPDLQQKKSVITFDIMFIMASNAVYHNITMFVVNFFQLKAQIPRYLARNRKKIYTQVQLNKIYEAPALKLFKNYAYLFKTLWLTAFFFPTVPIVIIFSLIGTGINFAIQKYLFSGVYRAPPMISSGLNKEVISLLKLTPFWMNLGSWLFHMFRADFIYDRIQVPVIFPHWIGLGISLAFLAIPNSLFLRIKRILWKDDFQFKQNPRSYQEADDKFFQKNYKSTNPKYIDEKHYLHYKDRLLKRKFNELRKRAQIIFRGESQKSLMKSQILDSRQNLFLANVDERK